MTVSTQPKLNPGLAVNNAVSGMVYEASKPSAFLSRPFAQARKIGVASFSIRGTTFHEWSESHTTSSRYPTAAGLS